MPSMNPRTNVTLSPSLDLLVVRLATLQRCSKSQVLRELLEAAEPALQRAVALMDAASKASESVRVGLAKSLTLAQDAAESHLSQQLEFMEGQTDLVAQAEGVRSRRPARTTSKAKPPIVRPAGGKRNDPHAVTRGLGLPKGGKSGGV